MSTDKLEKIKALFQTPLMQLIEQAHEFTKTCDQGKKSPVQKSALFSIKTGACPEDCAYCPQSGHYNTNLAKEKLCSVELVQKQAAQAKASGATRFCLGAAWKSPPKKDFPKVLEMIKAIKALDMQACVTLGTLSDNQAQQLKAAGLDYYNHNLDTSPEYYKKIITTRTYQERLDTLKNVANADLNVCCGGIIGMGETLDDRINFIYQLALLPKTPQSIPINMLIATKSTPLENQAPINELEFVRVIAVARIMFPDSTIRLSAGREDMSQSLQTLCFYVGASSVFIGDKLFTTNNQSLNQDETMLAELYG